MLAHSIARQHMPWLKLWSMCLWFSSKLCSLTWLYICMLPRKLQFDQANMFLSMANLARTASQFFINLLFIFILTMTMYSFFRALGALCASLDIGK